MLRVVTYFLVVVSVLSGPALSQQDSDTVWVQIEARPSLAQALDRAVAYDETLENVNGFALGGGWYAIAIGPFSASEAEEVLRSFRADSSIPRDSYIAQNSAYGTRFYPQALDLARRSEQSTDPTTAQASPTDPVAGTATANQADTATSDALTALRTAARDDLETPGQARTNEQLLQASEKQALQRALQWAGFYNATIDGAFGRGTRSAMAEWQRFNGFDGTGILTTAQRALLIGQYNEVLTGTGFARYNDAEIGLSIMLPLGRVAFERYDPPFAHFTATDGSTAQVLLISQPGDRATLASLYDVMQTLEIVPLEGPRELQRNSFTLVGRSASIVSETRVTLENGALKGFTLVWPTGDDIRRTRLVEEMAASLERLDGVLDPGAGDGAVSGPDLVSGLAVRKPRLARSGFFVNQRGAVVTTAEAVQACTRILLDDTYEARLSALDTERGLAILEPQQTLAPSQIASFSPAQPRVQTDVAVAGYSYEGLLGAPSMTFGRLVDNNGLSGEEDIARLEIESLPGDAGGPVFDGSGNVMGMLLPRADGSRRLPDDVFFALAGAEIAEAMRDAGLSLTMGTGNNRLLPEDITARGVEMTVLVSCWE